MGIMTMKQYKRLQEAKASGDMKLHAQIMDEEYGEDSTVVDVEVLEEFDYELAAGDKAAGLSNSEIAKKYSVTTQKVSAVLKKGE